MLYRYLGCHEDYTAEATPISLEAGDKIVFCSDGASEPLGEEVFCTLLSATNDPQQATEQIVKAAEAAGSKDNITCVTVLVE